MYCRHSPGLLASLQAAISPLYIQRVIRVKRTVSVRGNNCSLNYSYSLRSKTIRGVWGLGRVRENGTEFSSSCQGRSSFNASNFGMIFYHRITLRSILITGAITIPWWDEYLQGGQEKNLRSVLGLASVCVVGAAFVSEKRGWGSVKNNHKTMTPLFLLWIWEKYTHMTGEKCRRCEKFGTWHLKA